MCKWQDESFPYAGTKIQLSRDVFRDACQIIWKAAQNRQTINYRDVENWLKNMGHRKVNRGTIGHIVGEVSNQVARITNPSVYPSSIVVRRDTKRPGDGFWGLDMGTNPPSQVDPAQRRNMLPQYQNDVFSRHWGCDC